MDTSPALTTTNPLDALSGIMALERCLEQMEQIDLPLEHWFPKGMYARKIFMPAGTCLTTRIHKTEHMSIVLQGVCSVTSEDGTSKLIEAPAIFITYPGTKRALYIHEDTVWLTVHICEARTVDEAEAEVAFNCDSLEEYYALTGAEPEQLEAKS